MEAFDDDLLSKEFVHLDCAGELFRFRGYTNVRVEDTVVISDQAVCKVVSSFQKKDIGMLSKLAKDGKRVVLVLTTQTPSQRFDTIVNPKKTDVVVELIPASKMVIKLNKCV